MIISVRSHGLPLTADGREFVAGRLSAVLGRAADAVRAVRVYLADQNGPRGGVDKTCVLTVALVGGKLVTVVGRADGVVPAVNRAASRLASAVRRSLARSKVGRRVGTRKDGAG